MLRNISDKTYNTCDACGSIGKDYHQLPHPVNPDESTESSEITVLETVNLCNNCRKEFDAWYDDKVRKVSHDIESHQFISSSAEELAGQYESVYISFYAYKRLKRMRDKFSEI